MSIPRLIAVAVTLVLLCAGCTGSHRSPIRVTTSATHSKTTAKTASASPTQPSNPWDGKDPQTTICHSSAVDVPGSGVPIFLKGGTTLFGTLVLRRSSTCNTMWARVVGITRAGVDLNFSANRGKISSGYATSNAAVGVPQYTGMLAIIHGQCIFAEAIAGGGPSAKSICVNG